MTLLPVRENLDNLLLLAISIFQFKLECVHSHQWCRLTFSEIHYPPLVTKTHSPAKGTAHHGSEKGGNLRDLSESLSLSRSKLIYKARNQIQCSWFTHNWIANPWPETTPCLFYHQAAFSLAPCSLGTCYGQTLTLLKQRLGLRVCPWISSGSPASRQGTGITKRYLFLKKKKNKIKMMLSRRLYITNADIF